jgi:hypothetical protein
MGAGLAQMGFLISRGQTKCRESPCTVWDSPCRLGACETRALAGPLEGLGGETGDLPLHFARGGPVVCVW